MEDIEALVVRAQAGDLDAYGRIVCRFQDMAFGYAYTILGDLHLAEDAAQEAFTRGYRDLRQLREAGAFPGWLRRIVFTQCQRARRRRGPRAVSLDDAAGVASTAIEPVEVAHRLEMKEAVLAAVKELSENERTVTTLYYVNGYSQKDIADFLQVPVTTVDGRLRTSRKRLKKRMIAMVKDTLVSSTPDRDEFNDRVRFIIRLAELMEQGQPLLPILEQLAKEIESVELRQFIADALRQINDGGTLSQVFRQCRSIFPPMVTYLVETGERLGELDVTLRMAGQWWRHGKFKADPHAFTNASFYRLRQILSKAMGDDVVEVVVDGRHESPRPSSGGRAMVWLEYETADGARTKAEPIYPRSDLPAWTAEVKMRTVLAEQQEGDVLTGTLRLRLRPEDEQETLFPISFRPYEDGEEVRIRVAD